MLKNGAIINIIIIRNKLNNKMNGMLDRTIFLLLFLCSLTSLEIAMGNPSEHNVIKRLNVGKTRE